MQRTTLTLLLILILSASSYAQFYKSVLPSPEFNHALEKIVRDFKYNFDHIIGEQLESEGEADHYVSTVVLPGAINCVISKYHSVKDTTASWQGTLYSGEDYKEAVKTYKNTFRLVNKSRIQLVDLSYISFYGKLQEPSEAVRFTVSTLQLDVNDPRYERFKAEVELVPGNDGWQVNINFFNKKPDEEIE